MSSKQPSNIVADGRQRVIAGELAEVERKVLEKYAQQLAEAGFLQRFRLRWRIRRELRRELDSVAPKGGLYLHQGGGDDQAR